ncbi:hypothetical protein EXU85_30440 [Spirosoma sp. KCTC 42546]|uniref:energy transducer TonB n=1 Tax=Spirosoma sp. KCTC 42546 TaxID=2520506 RepID=UPI001156D976|nr:energy transducer TonB [Spirosoma sp. KCTC 42546]QDK82694.1 hypothetical protein EXU85_30440 [Spirosoma sp. KCTC 42546]
MRYWRLFLLFVSSHVAFAQLASPDLNQDPVFTTVLKRRLTYPRQAEWSSVYGRVFAGFTVDNKGRIQNISILNSSHKGTYYGFEPTIRTALKKLPYLSLQYAGSYILPVSFIFVDYRHTDKPFIPQDTLFIQDLAGRIILKEINVFGSSTNSRERIIAAEKNEPY